MIDYQNIIQIVEKCLTDCSVILKLDINSGETKDLDLKAETEYEVTISQSQLSLKAKALLNLFDKNFPVMMTLTNLTELHNWQWRRTRNPSNRT